MVLILHFHRNIASHHTLFLDPSLPIEILGLCFLDWEHPLTCGIRRCCFQNWCHLSKGFCHLSFARKHLLVWQSFGICLSYFATMCNNNLVYTLFHPFPHKQVSLVRLCKNLYGLLVTSNLARTAFDVYHIQPIFDHCEKEDTKSDRKLPLLLSHQSLFWDQVWL